MRILGFSAGSRLPLPQRYLATGTIQRISPTEDAFQIQIETGLSWAGSSGSPVLNEANAVVGIVYGGSWAEEKPIAVAATTAALKTVCQ